MFKELSVGSRMLIACSVVVLLFSSIFVTVGVSLSNLAEQVKPQHQAAQSVIPAAGLMAPAPSPAILDTIRSTKNIMVFGGLVSTLMAAIFGIWIVLGIRKQLGGEPAYAAEIVSRVAEGDLTVSVHTHANDDASLLFAVKNMVRNLIVMSRDVRSNSDNVNAASLGIVSENSALAQRNEEQLSILREAESGIEELRAAVLRNTESTRLAYQLAQGASDVAEQSGESVAKLVATMNDINDSSKKIEDIISVIDEIAFQTNILALNAAVEAARAGEQGRGFAVVAGEVRNLAQRSAHSAREIKLLIADSVGRINAGTVQVRDAAEGIGDVVTSVHLVASQMKEISAATADQGASIKGVDRAMGRLDEVARENAAVVDQATEAAVALQEQAAALMTAVSMFRLEAGESGKRQSGHETRSGAVPAQPVWR